MKKILLYTSILVLGALAAASCNLNSYPVFDDNDAFVAFDATGYQFNEPEAGLKDTVDVYVTLASVAGISTTVSYEAVDSTAIAGVDFDLLDANGVLNFDSENRTQTIKIVLYSPKAGTYTGDKAFTLKFKSTGSVNAGSESSCVITIADIDHPLNAILGSYTMSGTSYFNGPVSWNMTFEKDEEDVTVVWISGIIDSQTIGGFYGTVTMAADGITPESISVPLGQQSTETTSTCFLYGIDAQGVNIESSGNMTIEITNGGANIAFPTLGPALCADPSAGSYYGIILAGCTGVKN